MSQWILYDFRPALEGDEDGPVIPFTSEAECREKLVELSQEIPGVYILRNPERGTHLKIGLGRPFGFLSWNDKQLEDSGNAVADPTQASDSEWFLYEGALEEHTPEELIPVDQVIDAVTYLSQYGRRCPRLTWHIWDPKNRQWRQEGAET